MSRCECTAGSAIPSPARRTPQPLEAEGRRHRVEPFTPGARPGSDRAARTSASSADAAAARRRGRTPFRAPRSERKCPTARNVKNSAGTFGPGMTVSGRHRSMSTLSMTSQRRCFSKSRCSAVRAISSAPAADRSAGYTRAASSVVRSIHSSTLFGDRLRDLPHHPSPGAARLDRLAAFAAPPVFLGCREHLPKPIDRLRHHERDGAASAGVGQRDRWGLRSRAYRSSPIGTRKR